MHIHIQNGIMKLTLKQDRHGRLCLWPGNVQSRIVVDDSGQHVVPGEGALARLEGHDKHHVQSRLTDQIKDLLEQGFSVVLKREEVAI